MLECPTEFRQSANALYDYLRRKVE